MDGTMDWRTALGIAAGIITLVSILPYIVDILRGLTRPNLVTWWLWTLNGGILAFAQYTAGASWTLVVVVAATISTAMVAVLAVPFGQRDYGLFDAVCLVMALTALGGWWWTKDPLAAIVLAVVAEIFAVSPTIAKIWHAPETETPSTFWLTAFATILSMIASTKFDLANLLFPVYFIAVNTLIAVMATRGRRRMRQGAGAARGN
jgi:hypothetical protein